MLNHWQVFENLTNETIFLNFKKLVKFPTVWCSSSCCRRTQWWVDFMMIVSLISNWSNARLLLLICWLKLMIRLSDNECNFAIFESNKGPFIYHVSTFIGFLDPPPPSVSMFLVLKISKNWHFLTLPPYKYLRSIWMVLRLFIAEKLNEWSQW